MKKGEVLQLVFPAEGWIYITKLPEITAKSWVVNRTPDAVIAGKKTDTTPNTPMRSAYGDSSLDWINGFAVVVTKKGNHVIALLLKDGEFIQVKKNPHLLKEEKAFLVVR